MPRERTLLRYQLHRSRARKLAAVNTAELQKANEQSGPAIPDLSKVRFESIDVRALNAFARWDEPNFFWHDVVGWKAKEPLALDLSIWFDEQLCGLCFANPNNSRQRIRIVRLEGSPDDHPLKKRIVTLSVLVLTHYATIIGSKFIEVQEPLKGAIFIYQQHGFYFDAEGRRVKVLESLVSRKIIYA